MPSLTASHLLLEHEMRPSQRIVFDDNGLIRAIEPCAPDEVDTPSRFEELVAGTTLAAASLDIHFHGALGFDVMSASAAELGLIQRFLATCGVAHYLPTTVTASVDVTLRALERLSAAIERAPAPFEARPIGIHLEGPFLSHVKRGVHPPAHLSAPDLNLFDRFQQAARGHVLLLTLAPELPGALDLVRHATSQGVRVSLGHTDATAAQAFAALDAGATSATHTFNAMRALDHREPGVLGTVLDDGRAWAELICDGVHVAPAVVRLWLKAKGSQRAILVTDSMSASGSADGNYTLGGLPVTVARGRALLTEDLPNGKETLAGSLLTLDAAVRNFQQFTGASLATATALASRNPAAMLGRPELARIAPGLPANFNRYDAAGRLVATYLHGKEVPRPEAA